jgi:hypothetical protein
MFLVLHLDEKMFDIKASQNHKNATVTFSWKPVATSELIQNQIHGEIYLLFAVWNEDDYYPLEWVPAIKAKHTVFHKKPGQSTIKIVPFWMKSDACPFNFDPSTCLLEPDRDGKYSYLSMGIQDNYSLFLTTPEYNYSTLAESLDSVVHYNFKFQIIRKAFAQLNGFSRWVINWTDQKKPVDQCDMKVKTVFGVVLLFIQPFILLFAYGISFLVKVIWVINAFLLGVSPRQINFTKVFSDWFDDDDINATINLDYKKSVFKESHWLIPYFWVVIWLVSVFIYGIILRNPDWLVTISVFTILSWLWFFIITKLFETKSRSVKISEISDPAVENAKKYLRGENIETPITLKAQVFYEEIKSNVCRRYE